jgi:hypothetical protein
VSQYARGQEGYEGEMKELREEAGMQKRLGIESRFDVSDESPIPVGRGM